MFLRSRLYPLQQRFTNTLLAILRVDEEPAKDARMEKMHRFGVANHASRGRRNNPGICLQIHIRRLPFIAHILKRGLRFAVIGDFIRGNQLTHRFEVGHSDSTQCKSLWKIIRSHHISILSFLASSGNGQYSSIHFPVTAEKLSISLQSARALGVAFGDAEDEDAERDAHHPRDNQGPGVAPDGW